MLNRLEARVRSWVRTRFGDGADGSGRFRTDDQADLSEPKRTSVETLLSRDRVSKEDIVLETGLEPEEFIVEVVRREGGRMYQNDLVEAMGWNKTTMSRYLGEMEESGAIERVRVGQEKLVMHPDSVPDIIGGTEGRTGEA